MHEQDRVMSAVVFGWSNDVANQKAKKSWLEGERAADGLKYLYLITVTIVLHTWHVRWCTKFAKNERPNHAEQLPEKHDPLYAGGQSGNINIYYKLPTPDTETSN